jgi:hypothetical protein
MVMIGFAIITFSLAITRQMMKQSLWGRTLAAKEKMKMGYEECLGASQLGGD